MMNAIAGIVWDPREPPPPELFEHSSANLSDIGPQRRHDGPKLRKRVRHVSPERDVWQNLIIRKPEQNVLLPLSISVQVKVIQDVAQVTVVQLYWNNSDETICKGTYTLPLPAGCTVADFCCRIGDQKIVKAKAKPTEEARNTFHRALHNNQTAGLLEQHTPEIFTTTLGNIPKRTKLKAEISYVTLLKHEFTDHIAMTTTKLTIPTYIASRYGNPPAELPSELNAIVKKVLTIEVEIASAEKVQKISSDTHQVTIQRCDGTMAVERWEDFVNDTGAGDVQVALVKLSDGSTFLDKDFVLNIVSQPQHQDPMPQAWLEMHPSLPNHKALMLTIPPKLFLANTRANNDGEIIFVADRSGSMSDKIEALKSATRFLLQSIPEGQKFNVWCFGTSYTSLWSQSRENINQSTLNEAVAYVAHQFRADMGGTELLSVLEAVMATRDHRRKTDVIVLTDGQVWQSNRVIDFVQSTKTKTDGATRVFALGIGDAVSHELVEGLARAGGGYAEVILSASQGGWESRLTAMLAAAVLDHVHSLKFELEGETKDITNTRVSSEGLIQRPHMLQSPADESDLSPFSRNRIFMLLESSSIHSIKICYTAGDGKEVTLKIPLKPVEYGSVCIHKLAARAVLSDLERDQSWIQSHPYRPPHRSYVEEKMTRDEGEFLGRQWGLVSKWTSFVAVDEPHYQQLHESDAFMDAVNTQTQSERGGMDLLRPRGLPNLAALAQIPDLPPTDQITGVQANEDDRDVVNNLESPPRIRAATFQQYSRHSQHSDHRQQSPEDTIKIEHPHSQNEESGIQKTPNLSTPENRDLPVVAHHEQIVVSSRFFSHERYSGDSEDSSAMMDFGNIVRSSDADADMSAARLPPFKDIDERGSFYDCRAPADYECASAPNTSAMNHDSAPRSEPQARGEWIAGYSVQTGFLHGRYHCDSSLAQLHETAQKTASQEHGERVVRRLVRYQSYNGRFDFDSCQPTLIDVFGLNILVVIADLKAILPLPAECHNDAAVTMAIVVLFKEKLSHCKDLWFMIVSKATRWIDEQITNYGMADVTGLWNIARKRIQSHQLPTSFII